MEIVRYTRISDISERLFSFASSKEADTGKVIFVVPARPDMQTLKDILLERSTFGIQKWHIWRWADLYREIWSQNRPFLDSIEQRRQIDPPDHWIIVRHILSTFLEKEEIEERTELPPGVRTAGFISTLGNTLRELLREEVSPEDLADALGCDGCPENGACPEIPLPEGLLCRLYHCYLSYLEAGGSEGLFDSAQIATLTREALEIIAVEKPEWAREKQFIFAGFSSFNHSQKKLVEALEISGSMITVFSPRNGTEGSYTVKDQFPGAFILDIPHEPVRTVEIAGGDRRIELETIAREMVMWSRGCGNIKDCSKEPFPGWENTGIVIPDRLLPTAAEVLEKYHIPYNVRHGLTAYMTPLWEVLQRIRNCWSRGWPGRETLRLLREPVFAGERIDRESLGTVLPSGRLQWHKNLETMDDQAVQIFKALTDFTDQVEMGDSPSGLLELISDLSEKCEWEIKLSIFTRETPFLDERSRQFNAALREAREKIQSVKQLQKDIGAAGEKNIKGQAAFTFLANWASETTIWHRPGNMGSMDIFAGTPPVFAEKDVWIFCEASSSSWPGNIRESALLPDSRKELLHSTLALGDSHLPLLSEQRRQQEMLFNRICACGKKLTILAYPLTDSAGRPLEPSGYIKKGMDDSRDDPWLIPVSENSLISRGPGQILPSEGENRVGPSEVYDKTFFTEKMAERVLPVERNLREHIESVSISDIDTWAACPFRYYCMRILNLEEDRELVYDPARGGMVLHELWRRIWEEGNRDITIEAGGIYLLDEVTDTFYPELRKEPALFRFWSKMQRQVKNIGILQDKMEATGIRDRSIPPSFEGSLPELEIKGVKFRGRFDRLDILEDGTGILCDYKSGRSPNFRHSLQLPAYALLYERGGPVGKLPEKISGYCYICHGDGHIFGVGDTALTQRYLLFKKNSSVSTEEKKNKALETLEAMAESISRGIFEPDYDSDACSYCQYDGICRKYESTALEGTEIE